MFKVESIFDLQPLSYCQKYEEELQQALKQKYDPIKTLKPVPRWRSLILGELDKMVLDYLGAVRRRGVSKCGAISVAKVLIKRHSKMKLGNIDFNYST